MPRRLLLALLAGVLGACSRSKPPPAPPPPEPTNQVPAQGVPGCTLYSEPRQAGAVPDVLPELSGLAASQRHPGAFWAHNDSGNGFALFAMDAQGVILARLKLTGAEPRDLEDVTVGPCAPGAPRTCIFLADIGDNFARREQVRLYRLPEPEALEDATAAVEVLPFLYPDGPRDAESVIIDARSGRLAVITKSLDSLGDVFALDGLSVGTAIQAKKLGTLTAPLGMDRATTAASLHASGERLLLRTYSRAYELRRPGAARLEDLLRGQLVEVPSGSQAQAEAISYVQDGNGYLLGTEFTGQPLWLMGCR
ncbi:hypothetical protein [Corallococcus macrosporus]|uniref:Lipoprotein n=1 Tax=Corallococcus macrosporus DSM 14697 TaxID=1189310 RepID=A0A250JXN5_9BACT|nr:hypothetical protein [Corallococcus macrosporus]ATB48629.1 hypothetical protein MYMAC_004257 [Corallococcus macrosporus DSM 14697]